MMSNQAKRELTLEEWVDQLPPKHRAREEHTTLKRELKTYEWLKKAMGAVALLAIEKQENDNGNCFFCSNPDCHNECIEEPE